MWVKKLEGPGTPNFTWANSAYYIMVDKNRNVYVTGFTYDEHSMQDITTVMYSQP